MGSCLSFPSRAKATPADGTLTQDSSALPSSSSSSLSRISSKNWKEKKKEKKKRKKKKEKKGGGGGGLFDRRSVGTSGRILGRVQGEEFDEDKLHLVPGRMFLNGATDVACLFTQQGRKGTNQDAMIVWENFTSRSDTVFCGVFDGHGPFGHMVAKKVRDSLPLKLHTQWKAKAGDQDSPHQNGSVLESMNSEETTSISLHDEWAEPLDVDENEKLPEMYPTLKQSLLKAFKLMDKELKLHPTIDCFCSGTTAVTVVKQGQDLVIGNLGDSRAILGTRDKDNNLVALQLTVDLKPNLPNEAARIQQCKGRVFAMQDEPEVARVWLPNNDSPGLAMARAFGDFCLKDYGLISVPDISYRQLTHRDEFIVLATDGIWDVLSNKEVVDIVASAPTRATAARALIDCAIRAWRLKYPTSKTDDCAVVCLYLDHPPSSDDQPEKSASNTIPTEPGEMMVPGSMDQEANHKEEIHGSVAGGTHIDSSGLEHSHNLRDADEIVPVSESKEEKMPGRSRSTRSLADCISTTEEEEWTALEGVSRANSLLNLPRFLSGDRRSASRRKWL